MEEIELGRDDGRIVDLYMVGIIEGSEVGPLLGAVEVSTLGRIVGTAVGSTL